MDPFAPAHRPARWVVALPGLAALVWIPQAWLIAGCIDSLLTHRRSGVPQADEVLAGLLQAAVLVIVLGVFRAGLDCLGARLAYTQARNTLSDWRWRLIARLVETSPLDPQRPPAGRIASVWMEQAEAIIPWLARYRAAQWRVLIVAPFVLLAVGLHSWAAALVLLVAAPLIPLFMAIIGWRAQSAAESQALALGNLHGQLLERLRALQTLRALHAVEAAAMHLRRMGKQVADRTMRVLNVAMLSSAVLELFSALGVALVAVYIGFHLLGQLPFGTWDGRLSLHTGLFVLMLAPAFFEPLRELSAVWHDRANGRAALRNLHTLLDDLAPPVGQTSMAGPLSSAVAPGSAVAADGTAGEMASADEAGSVEVPVHRESGDANGTFRIGSSGNIASDAGDGDVAGSTIESGRLAGARIEGAMPCAVLLRNVRPLRFGVRQDDAASPAPVWNIRIPAGAQLALVGPSGTGKTMLLALIAGLIRTEQGEISVGGLPMTAENLERIRARIGWMGQHPSFVSGSVQRNLWLTSRGCAARQMPFDDVRSDGALLDEHFDRLGLADALRALQHATLGENGSGLSGGESLRLALVRLMLKPDTDLLLLDEPTAHLDQQTADRVLHTIRRIARGKTLVVASHDPRVIEALPGRLVLDAQGRLHGPLAGGDTHCIACGRHGDGNRSSTDDGIDTDTGIHIGAGEPAGNPDRRRRRAAGVDIDSAGDEIENGDCT
ncbi:MAG: ATP-binding cassette domain-containing protein [Lautropia sp.]|nr:ATP-binding cassette domain-containing protein [Lautropia sp.]